MKPAISSDSEIMGGTPCLTGTRVPFQTLLDDLEGGDSLDEFQAGDLALANARVA
jgi:uncharacterized protein (DUF433 family)